MGFPVLGLVMLIVGLILEPFTVGASTPLVIAGIGMCIAPGIVEGIGHTIHSLYHDRAPDFMRLVIFATSCVGGALGMVAAAFSSAVALSNLFELGIGITSLIPTAFARHVNTPRQSVKDFFLKSLLDFTCFYQAIKSRWSKSQEYKLSKAPELTPENPSINQVKNDVVGLQKVYSPGLKSSVAPVPVGGNVPAANTTTSLSLLQAMSFVTVFLTKTMSIIMLVQQCAADPVLTSPPSLSKQKPS